MHFVNEYGMRVRECERDCTGLYGGNEQGSSAGVTSPSITKGEFDTLGGVCGAGEDEGGGGEGAGDAAVGVESEDAEADAKHRRDRERIDDDCAQWHQSKDDDEEVHTPRQPRAERIERHCGWGRESRSFPPKLQRT